MSVWLVGRAQRTQRKGLEEKFLVGKPLRSFLWGKIKYEFIVFFSEYSSNWEHYAINDP